VENPLYVHEESEGSVLLNFPHSGTWVPPDVAAQLNPLGRKITDTDWHVPKLYEFARGSVSWLQATHGRVVVDLNRDPQGANLYPGQATTGLCPVTEFTGAGIYRDGQHPDIAVRRARYFDPYHQQLADQIERIRARHGFCILLDCHSIKSTLPLLFSGQLPDLNLGTFDGVSCAPQLADLMMLSLQDNGFSFVQNGRFKGGWITRHYGKPAQGVHALQLEISQACYMDENQPEQFDTGKAAALQTVLQNLITRLTQAQIS